MFSWSREHLKSFHGSITLKLITHFTKYRKYFNILNCQKECPFSSLQHFNIRTLAFIIMISADWEKKSTQPYKRHLTLKGL